MRGVEEEIWLRQVTTIGWVFDNDFRACVVSQVQQGAHLVDDVVGTCELRSVP